MERNQFLKTTLATMGLAVMNPLSLLNLLESEKEITLPFIDGNRKVTLLKPKMGLFTSANAQSYGYYNNYSYGNLAPYQQWYAYQQALTEWNRRLIYWQQQQYYTWLQQAHIQRMQAVLAHYNNYQYIGQPDVWPTVKSIYAFAKDNFNQPTLFGINKSRQEVAINSNLRGAAKIFNAVNQYFGNNEAEKTVGPQSSEKPAKITLPNNDFKWGKYYKTENGFLAVSNPNQKVMADNGYIGQLAKYVTGPDGEQYAVV